MIYFINKTNKKFNYDLIKKESTNMIQKLNIKADKVSIIFTNSKRIKKNFHKFKGLVNKNEIKIFLRKHKDFKSNLRIMYVIAHELVHAKQIINKEFVITENKYKYKSKSVRIKSNFSWSKYDSMKNKSSKNRYLYSYFPWEKDAILFGRKIKNNFKARKLT